MVNAVILLEKVVISESAIYMYNKHNYNYICVCVCVELNFVDVLFPCYTDVKNGRRTNDCDTIEMVPQDYNTVQPHNEEYPRIDISDTKRQQILSTDYTITTCEAYEKKVVLVHIRTAMNWIMV